jgi:TRAP-type C4-dicarboxylate transport system permease large subunit
MTDVQENGRLNYAHWCQQADEVWDIFFDLACAIRDTARTTSATLFIIAVSMIFGWIVVVNDVPDLIFTFV